MRQNEQKKKEIFIILVTSFDHVIYTRKLCHWHGYNTEGAPFPNITLAFVPKSGKKFEILGGSWPTD